MELDAPKDIAEPQYRGGKLMLWTRSSRVVAMLLSAFLLTVDQPVCVHAQRIAQGTALTIDIVRIVVVKQGRYDVETAVRQQLQEVGLRAAPATATKFDATLTVNYDETPCGDYVPVGKGTCISCKVALLHPTGGTLLEDEFNASTEWVVQGVDLWTSAVRQFEDYSGFALLGLNIAQRAQRRLPAHYLDTIRPKLEHKSWGIRFRAVQALPAIQDPRATEFLVAALADPDHVTRGAAAEGLGERGSPRAADALIAHLKTEDNLYVIRIAANALGRIGDRRVVDALRAIRADIADPDTRGAIDDALKRLGETR